MDLIIGTPENVISDWLAISTVKQKITDAFGGDVDDLDLAIRDSIRIVRGLRGWVVAYVNLLGPANESIWLVCHDEITAAYDWADVMAHEVLHVVLGHRLCMEGASKALDRPYSFKILSGYAWGESIREGH